MAGNIYHKWVGSVLTITSDSGTSSCDLKGERGDDGPRGAQGAPGSSVAEDSQKLGGVAAAQYALKNNVPAHNLLDNSDFTNPVNQRGQTNYTGAGYTIDRWKAGVSDCSMYVNAGQSVAFNTKTEGVNAYWRQYLPHSLSQLEGKTFTLAIKDTWGKTHCASGVYPTSAPSDTKSVIWINMYENVSIVLYCTTDGTAFVQLTTKKSVPIVWAALYEGSYDASTLPAYVPKGYAAELAECQRYYVYINSGAWMTGFYKIGEGLCVEIPTAGNIRINNPTVILDNPKAFTGTGWNNLKVMSVSVNRHATKIVFDFVDPSAAQASYGDVLIVYGIDSISADL